MPALAEPRTAESHAGDPPARGRRVRTGVSWTEYRALRADPANRRLKLTYDGPAGGLLEIEMPQGLRHETVSRLVLLLVAAFAEERGLAVKAVGSVTQSREDLERGLEGDESFFVGDLSRLSEDWDLDRGDPPPDLSVEVDVTSPGVSKLPIYAALGVPEVWVWADEAITVRRLAGDGTYEVVGDSGELPGFPVAAAAAVIARRGEAPHYDLLAEFRAAAAK